VAIWQEHERLWERNRGEILACEVKRSCDDSALVGGWGNKRRGSESKANDVVVRGRERADVTCLSSSH
jgi:hypothetical protein